MSDDLQKRIEALEKRVLELEMRHPVYVPQPAPRIPQVPYPAPWPWPWPSPYVVTCEAKT